MIKKFLNKAKFIRQISYTRNKRHIDSVLNMKNYFFEYIY